MELYLFLEWLINDHQCSISDRTGKVISEETEDGFELIHSLIGKYEVVKENNIKKYGCRCGKSSTPLPCASCSEDECLTCGQGGLMEEENDRFICGKCQERWRNE